MSRMLKLQNITFPKPGICFEQALYCRPLKEFPDVEFHAEAQYFSIRRGGGIYFDTYFNAISLSKWKRYTNLGKIYLELDLCGSFVVTLLHTILSNGNISEQCVFAKRVEQATRGRICLPYPETDGNGILSFRIDALEDDSSLYGGCYLTDTAEEQANSVFLALNICNYARDAYIYRNMDIVQRYILDDANSDLRGHLQIFIADNSASLDIERLPVGIAHVFPQGDFGGAGGFARGLLELLRRKQALGLTHAVMMDDDILFEPETLERLYLFLRLVKSEYAGSFVGGGLFRLDIQNIQVCQGGEWSVSGGTYEFHKQNHDMSLLYNVLLNEIEDGAKIGAWWFHCIPLSQISLQNLPYPFFFHMDDVEYDLRNCKHIIHLNGVSVWHEPFENKPGSHLAYYNTRNILITHMIHEKRLTRLNAWHFLNGRFIHHLLGYRYKEANLTLRGIEDALRGPQWLLTQTPPDQLLEEILSQGYRKFPLDQLPFNVDYRAYVDELNAWRPESAKHRILRLLTANGYLTKALGVVTVLMIDARPVSTFRKKQVLNYDPLTDRGFITEKSYKELFRTLRRYRRVCSLLNKRFDTARQEYIKSFPSMTNEQFWSAYLDIKE